MPRSTLAGLLLVAPLLVACGSRSPLLDGASTSGAGGGGSTSSSSASSSSASSSSSSSSSSVSSSSSSSTGGLPLTCKEIFLSGEPITYEPTPTEHGVRPTLVPVVADETLVSVVFEHNSAVGPEAKPRVAHVTFAPWGPWPSTLGPSDQAVSIGGNTFVASPSNPAGQPGFATLSFLPKDQLPSDMYFAPSVQPHTSYDPLPKGISWPAGKQAWAVAMARGPDHHLAAYEVAGSHTSLSMGIIDAASLDGTFHHDIACATSFFDASAVPTQGGFLIAAPSGRKFGECGLDDDTPGIADEVQVMRFDLGTQGLTLSTVLDSPGVVQHLALAGAAQGAWVVWQGNGKEGATAWPPIRAMRLDEAGLPAGPTFDVNAEGIGGFYFATAALGDLLAVAWIDWIAPSSPNLRLGLFDASGAFVTGSSINLGTAWLASYDTMSLLPAPDGNGLLFAWADFDVPPAVVHVARFTCAGGT